MRMHTCRDLLVLLGRGMSPLLVDPLHAHTHTHLLQLQLCAQLLWRQLLGKQRKAQNGNKIPEWYGGLFSNPPICACRLPTLHSAQARLGVRSKAEGSLGGGHKHIRASGCNSHRHPWTGDVGQDCRERHDHVARVDLLLGTPWPRVQQTCNRPGDGDPASASLHSTTAREHNAPRDARNSRAVGHRHPPSVSRHAVPGAA